MSRIDMRIPYPGNVADVLNREYNERYMRSYGRDLNCTIDELSKIIPDFLMSIREEEASIFFGRFATGLTQKAIGEKLGMSTSAVRIHEKRTITRLYRHVRKYRDRRTKKIWIRVGMSVTMSEMEYQKVRAVAFDKKRSEELGFEVFRELGLEYFPDWFQDRVRKEGVIDGDSYIPDTLWSEWDKEVFEDE